MKRFHILALSGGGTKGFLQLGALQELEERVGNLTEYFDKGIYGCSIGSIIATAIAFGIDSKKGSAALKELLNFNFVTKSLSIESLKNSVSRKGLFEMNGFDEVLIKCFNSWNIDIKNKRISDSLVPLHIISSNLTKGVPTIFRGNVPILTALRASCCIPGVFRPQIIKNNVYIDGGYFTTILMKLIPKEIHGETLAIDIIHTNPGITPTNLEKLSVPEFLYKLYKLSCLYEVGNFRHPNIMNVFHNSGSGFGDPSESEKEDMSLTGRCFMRAFLTKC